MHSNGLEIEWVRMSKKIRSFVVAGAAWLAVGHAWSQESLLSGYLDRLLATHPAIRSKELARQSTDQLVTSAWMQFLPTPSVSLDKGPASGGSSQAATYRISQPIWTGGRLTAGLDAARLRHEQADLDIQETAQSLSLKLIALYATSAPVMARYIMVRKDQTSSPLSFNELQVMSDGVNVALGKTTTVTCRISHCPRSCSPPA